MKNVGSFLNRIRSNRNGATKTGAYLFLAMAVVLLSYWFSSFTAHADDISVRWDIISVQPPPPTAPRNVLPGGIASALANDGSMITVTGSGTFAPGQDDQVTGGGNWTTFDSAGNSTGTGTYTVTGLASFQSAPGTIPTGNIDLIDPADPSSAGLVYLRIAYSDDSRGILVVSCHLMGSPNSIFEGITASKGFVGFWNRVAPAPNVDANRTTFHILSETD